MGWRVAADATLVAHFGFILFMVAGGVLARRWNSLTAIHLAVLAYGVTISGSGSTLLALCPPEVAQEVANNMVAVLARNDNPATALTPAVSQRGLTIDEVVSE